METDLGLKVIRLSQPVSMKDSVDPFDISAGTDNAEKILDEKGADLIIWGTEDMQGDGHQWSVYVSASAHAQCLAREQGFSIHSTTDLDDVGEADLLEVLDWATLCWRGLLDSSQGMYIAKTIEPMVDKIDTVLGLAAEKQMGNNYALGFPSATWGRPSCAWPIIPTTRPCWPKAKKPSPGPNSSSPKAKMKPYGANASFTSPWRR
jgi:hypothetical protein